jgi:predicted ATPase
LERAVALLGPDTSPLVIGEDVKAAALGFLSVCLAVLGYPAAAKAHIGEAVKRAHQRQDPHTIAIILGIACRVHCVLRDARQIAECLDEMSSIATEHDLRFVQTLATNYRGWALGLRGRFMQASSLLHQGISALRGTGAVWQLPWHQGMLAEVRQHAGHAEEALSLIEHALELVERTRVAWTRSELHRVKGEILQSMRPSHSDRAAQCLRRAIDTARGQDARLWELRAATSLARLWRDQGRRTQAHNLLAPVYGWFTEGFDTTDLKEAKTLLNELA